jgi:hypothetical protein
MPVNVTGEGMRNCERQLQANRSANRVRAFNMNANSPLSQGRELQIR